MTGTTTVDVALVHVEKHDEFEQLNGDKIAEAEALAAEALRMANEAKRAAERLAEVKKTLAMFSQKLDTVEKVVVAPAPKPESPRSKKTEEPVESRSIPPPPEDESTIPPPPPEDDSTVPPPPVQKKSVAFKEEVETAATVQTEELVVEKDIFEATLDQWGVDKMCGVDDDTIAQELGLALPPKPVKENKEAPTPKEEEKTTEAPVAVREVASEPETPSEPEADAPVAAEETTPEPEEEAKAVEPETALAVVEDDDEHKDFLEKTLDSIGLDRLCGIDEVALGFKDSYPEPVPPPPPTPFENPTRIEIRELPVQEILHSESHLEKRAKEIRKERHMPAKQYQRDPVNHDFVDPFGVDHDDFVMCGKLADICEPDLDALQEPLVYSITEAPAPEPEQVNEEPKEEEQEICSEKAASKDDVSLRGGDPRGEKSSFDSILSDEKVYSKTTTMTHGNLRSTNTIFSEARSVSVVSKPKTSIVSQSVPEEEAATIEEREDEEVYRRQLQEHTELLAAVDNHIWCL
ncbi:MAG: hypothetical protein SGILL_008556 [Bacillariaceae sp.]